MTRWLIQFRWMMALVAAMPLWRASLARADAPRTEVPAEYRNVGVKEHLNSRVPMDLEFFDEKAKTVKLSDFFQTGRPVILQLGYYDCPKLCDVISRDLVDGAKKMSLDAGTDFSFVFVSINPSESPDLAAMKRESFIQEYDKPGSGSGFHCLVGLQHNIDQLAQAVGFQYNKLPQEGQYAHPAVLMVLTPDGKISRYLYGVHVEPQTLKLSLVEASAGKIGSTADQIVLLICSYDVITGKYAMTAIKLMRLTGALTVLALGGALFWMFRHEGRLRTLVMGKEAHEPAK